MWKPVGYSSNHVVQAVKTLLSEKSGGGYVKLGHGGTLDPLASGVLVLGVGAATKSLGDFLCGTKEYIVEGCFGSSTSSFDREGTVTSEYDDKDSLGTQVTDKVVLQALENFKGDIKQKAPIFSALRVNGKRMYDIARHSSLQDIERLKAQVEARPVNVSALELLELEQKEGCLSFTLRIVCSSGTYIRSIVHDLGMAVQVNSKPVYAHMVSLVRTRQGPFLSSKCAVVPADYLDPYPVLTQSRDVAFESKHSGEKVFAFGNSSDISEFFRLCAKEYSDYRTAQSLSLPTGNVDEIALEL